MQRFFISQLLLLFIFYGCKTTKDDISDTNNVYQVGSNGSSLELIGEVFLTSSQDGRTDGESFSDVQIQITGEDSELVSSSEGSASSGQINLYIDSANMPSDLANNPLEFEVLVTSSQSSDGDIVSTGKSFVYQGTKIEETIGVVRRSKVNSLEGIGGETVDFSISSDGTLASQQTLSISTSGGSATSKSTVVTLPLGTQFQDDNGNVLSNSNVSVKAIIFDAEESSTTIFFPGGMNPNQVKMLDGRTTAGNFISAGFIALDMFVGDSEVKKFSNPIKVEMQLSSNLELSIGDEIPFWSFDDSNGVWTEEGSAIVESKNGNLYATMEVSHLSYWSFDFFSYTCNLPNRSIPIKLGNIPDKDNYSRLRLHALFTPSGSSSRSNAVVIEMNINPNEPVLTQLPPAIRDIDYDIVFYSDISKAYAYINGISTSLPEHLGLEIKNFNPCIDNLLDISDLDLDSILESSLYAFPATQDVRIKLPELKNIKLPAYISLNFGWTGNKEIPYGMKWTTLVTSDRNPFIDTLTLPIYSQERLTYNIELRPYKYKGDAYSIQLENPIELCSDTIITIDLTNYRDEIESMAFASCGDPGSNLFINAYSSRDLMSSDTIKKSYFLVPVGLNSDMHKPIFVRTWQKFSVNPHSANGYNLLVYKGIKDIYRAWVDYVNGYGPMPEGELLYNYQESTGKTIDFCSINEINLRDYLPSSLYSY